MQIYKHHLILLQQWICINLPPCNLYNFILLFRLFYFFLSCWVSLCFLSFQLSFLSILSYIYSSIHLIHFATLPPAATFPTSLSTPHSPLSFYTVVVPTSDSSFTNKNTWGHCSLNHSSALIKQTCDQKVFHPWQSHL